MRASHHQEIDGKARRGLFSTAPPESGFSSWSRLTFGEFVRQVESQFGISADSRGLLLHGLTRDEPLTPLDIRLLCSELGLPPEDFGA